MFGSEESILRSAWIFLAALAGGVTALAFMPWREMKAPEIALTVFVGTTFSLFVVPWLAHRALGIGETELRGIAACCYIGAAGAYTFIPKLVKKASKGDSL